ncbi:unnamed protein product [Pseudo-nitzschia multistriata]|uniref:HSF-type DNA-binding domain-containing protein n=1 Tax=Pseudo-nitzschia multistriata TaxID=183589 RepID=A0A448ZQD2_9STRA|nr:unnamed protein product [Pseudo-nitzschia multistriata]
MPIRNTSTGSSSSGKKRPPVFPKRLYDMLQSAERDGYAHLISWMPDGNSFKIHVDGSPDPEDEKAIVRLLKQVFNQTRFKSFVRQLQLYGFERTYKGPRRGECRHPLFIRGRRDLLDKKSIDNFQQKSNDKTSRRSKHVRQLLQKSPSRAEVISFMRKNDSRIETYSMQSLENTASSPCQYLNTSVIPTKLHNLVLSDSDCSTKGSDSCNENYDDEDLSVIVSNPLLDDPPLNNYQQTVDNLYGGDLISIHDSESVFPDWTGIELEILRSAL